MNKEYEEIKKEVIQRYGEEAYYKKLEEFYKIAESLRMDVTISTELEMPIYAKLRFEPLLVWRENQEIGDKIRELIKNDN